MVNKSQEQPPTNKSRMSLFIELRARSAGPLFPSLCLDRPPHPRTTTIHCSPDTRRAKPPPSPRPIASVKDVMVSRTEGIDMEKYPLHRRLFDSERPLLFTDAAVLAAYDQYLISSPNMIEIPEPHVYQHETVRARADGRFAAVDPHQHPQLYHKNWAWAPLIPRPDCTSTHVARRWGWDRFQYKYWARSSDNSAIGRLSPEACGGLRAMLNDVQEKSDTWFLSNSGQKPDDTASALRDFEATVIHLETTPVTYRDALATFAHLQRSYLSLHAFMDYKTIVYPRMQSPSPLLPHEVNLQWMGAFTDDPATCKMLYDIGVPVWYIRRPHQIPPDMNILHHASVTPANVCYQDFYDESSRLCPFPVLRSNGPGSWERLKACRLRAASKWILEAPATATTEATMSSQLEKQRHANYDGSSTSQRDRWTIYKHELMPACDHGWYYSLQAVKTEVEARAAGERAKQSTSRGKARGVHALGVRRAEDTRGSGRVGHGLRFPDPALLCSAKDVGRRSTYIANWMRARKELINDVDARYFDKQWASAKGWRPFLLGNMEPGVQLSKTERAEAEKFMACFSLDARKATRQDVFKAPPPIQWRGEDVDLVRLANAPPLDIRRIVWEAAELSFRYEFLALDHHLASKEWDKDRRARMRRVCDAFDVPSNIEVLAVSDVPLPSQESPRGLHINHPDDAVALHHWELFRRLINQWDSVERFAEFTGEPSRMDRWNYPQRMMKHYIREFERHTGRPPILPLLFPFV
ncbi:hypothetical protein CONPUDRAFT_160581 [Coniophora puteana RWD-64-598 SS2]|uniref:Uncharacterized protein n=1 Tax=Coniophora puteana (strain RWD-64-598) TaxID=741705 RepID=R7SFP3_CONPW|nr:uncharacterized protein CONPUDRAFT_160581 [Coniophora puteana RWD-64-598 SS2]EIW73909.1 hypothetical protein CONPUDRAFT_160581 [Coniophora puteana RWD-64-598 SS2]